MLYDSAFLLGCLGGALAEGAHIFGVNRSGARGHGFPKSRFQWASALFWVLAGGLLAFAQDEHQDLGRYVAIQLGAAGPLIVQKISGEVPQGGPGSIN